MPSTYTGSGIELIADGEQSGTWGQTTNDNLQIINRLTSEAGSIALSGTTHTLTISDGTLSDGQYGVLVFGGSPSGTNTVTISPNDAKRIFIVRNTTAQSVVMTQGSGGNVTILAGDSAVVYCNGVGAGSAVVDVSATFITSNNLKVASNLSDLASASTARTNLGVAIGTNVQAWDANLDQIAALAVTDGNFIVGNGSAWVAESGATARTSLGLGSIATQNSNSVSITGGSVTGITDIAIADGGTGSSTDSGARSNLGVAIGSDVQAWDANLDQIAALAVTDGNIIVGNGSAWVAESGATARTSLGLTIGTNVQAWDANLDQIAALAVTDGNFIVGNGSAWVVESGATARTSLGLGSIATLSTVTLGTNTTGNYVATNVAGAGIDVSGATGNVTISLEADLRGDVTHVGPDATDYITWTNNSYTSFFVNGGEQVRIESDGDLHADGDVIAFSTTISDPRLKHDIKRIDGALDKLMQLNGYTFTYNKNEVKSAGVLSTEVAKVLPSAVKPTKLPLQGADDKIVYDTVYYDQLHGLLIEAIKEQQAHIEALRAEVAGLKG